MIKLLPKQFGGIAQAVLNITTSEDVNIGFKTYEEMLFKGSSGISNLEWMIVKQWYKVFAYISSTLILIAVIIISYKMIASSFSTVKRNEAKETLINLLFRWSCDSSSTNFYKISIFLK